MRNLIAITVQILKSTKHVFSHGRSLLFLVMLLLLYLLQNV